MNNYKHFTDWNKTSISRFNPQQAQAGNMIVDKITKRLGRRLLSIKIIITSIKWMFSRQGLMMISIARRTQESIMKKDMKIMKQGQVNFRITLKNQKFHQYPKFQKVKKN
jgi:hypothetical protein